MPVAVRNNARSVVVFSSKTLPDAIRWSPKDSPDGEDLQQVPEELAKDTRFLRAVGIGMLEVISDDDAQAAIVEAINKQAARYRISQQSEKSEVDEILARSNTNTPIVITEAQMDAHIAALSKAQPSELSTIGE